MQNSEKSFCLYFKNKADIVAEVSQAVTSALHDEMSKIRARNELSA